jgi:hypothetical protein
MNSIFIKIFFYVVTYINSETTQRTKLKLTMHRKWRQSTVKRAIKGSEFTGGVIDFDFGIGSNNTFIPNKTYFRIGVKLEGPINGETGLRSAPAQVDDVAFANFCAGNMFDNAIFYAGGQPVSSCTGYAPQAHAIAYRLRKSGAWLESIGKDCYGICSSYLHRKQLVSTDGNGKDEAASVPSLDEGDSSIRYFIYQPPLGIMEHDKPMGAGQYRFQFNPAANFETACVESTNAKVPADYKFSVESMELYVCEEQMNVTPTGVDKLHLMEHQVQKKPLSASTSVDFTVNASTKAISIFVQHGAAGSTTLCPPSNFTTLNSSHTKLKGIQLTFANTTKPPTNWTNDTGTHINKLQQRYLDTQLETGFAFSTGGCETMSDWINNGPVYHYTFERDSNDRATQVQLQMLFDGEINEGDNVFVVAHYTRSVDIHLDRGFITQVVAQNI